MERKNLNELINFKTLYNPFHRYIMPFTYKVKYNNIYEDVLALFNNKNLEIYEPAYSIFRAVCYAFTLNNYFNLDVFTCLKSKELLFDNKFLKHNDYLNLYKKIINEIKTPFIYLSCFKIIDQCKEEYGINIKPFTGIEGCFITPNNKIIYNNRHMTHSRYLLCKTYTQIKNINEELDWDFIVKKSIGLGWIRINIENDYFCITARKSLTELQKKLIYKFYKENKKDLTKKFIIEKNYNSNDYKEYKSISKLLLDN